MKISLLLCILGLIKYEYSVLGHPVDIPCRSFVNLKSNKSSEIFTKLLTSEVNNRFICSSGQLSNLYQGILLAISQTVIIQTHGNLIFKNHYCDVINNSQTFNKILTAARLTFSTELLLIIFSFSNQDKILKKGFHHSPLLFQLSFKGHHLLLAAINWLVN